MRGFIESQPGRFRRLSILFGNLPAERWIIIALMVLACAARIIPGPRMIDDAFITFRYARNVVQGIGFVYNLGERVLGTTTPFYTLLMAALAALTHSENYPLLALSINALADAASTFLLYHLGRRLSNSPLVGWAAALLWAMAPMSVTFAIGGMETSVFILLMLGTFTAHWHRRLYLSAGLAALSLLTRPDAALIAAIVFGQLLLENIAIPQKSLFRNPFSPRKRVSSLHPMASFAVLQNIRCQKSNIKVLAAWVLAFALVTAPWFIFATAYFGSPIPQSVSAKSLAYRLPPEAALARFIQHLAVPFSESQVFDLGGLIRLVLYLTLYLSAILSTARREPRSLPLLTYPLVYVAVFALANPLLFRWYLAPPLPGYMLGILLGIYQILNAQYRLSKLNIRYWVLGAIVVWYLISGLRAWTLHPDHGPDRPAPQMAYIQLELLYHQVASHLMPFVGADTVIAAGDIGALGYDTNARILDTLGLISRQTLSYYPLDPGLYVGAYAMPPQLIFDQRPDWIVSPEVYIRKGILKDPRLSTHYELFETIPTDIYESRGLLVFRRK